MSKRDYLKITIISPDGFQQHDMEGVDVPRKGDDVSIHDELGLFLFSGEVFNVVWHFRDTALGNSVQVWLK